MNTRNNWLSNYNSSFDIIDNTYYTREEIISEVQENFDIRRYQSAEGYNISIINDIVSATPTYEQVLIQDFTNPLNEHREDRKIHFETESVAHRGSYVIWKERYWLVLTKVETNEAYLSAKITETNNNFKWIDTYGNIRSYPCVIEDKVNNSLFDEFKSIILPSGSIIVHVQRNEYTDEIYENKRFLFDGQAFKVNFVKNFIDKNLVSFIMTKDQKNIATDNIELDIADYNIAQTGGSVTLW